MSSSSDSARRPGHQQPSEQSEGRRASKYEIYGSTTKPFGEGYRKSVLLQDQKQEEDGDSGRGQEREESSVDTDSVEGRSTMGCSESRSGVAVADETVKGSFVPKEVKPAGQETEGGSKMAQRNGEVNSQGVSDKKLADGEHTEVKVEEKTSFDTIYGTEIRNINDNGYSTVAIYSEVKKETKKIDQNSDKTPREKLMQQIRDRKQNDIDEKENVNCATPKLHPKAINEDNTIETERKYEEISVKDKDNKLINTIVTSAPVSFVEEEYSYEPDKKEATSKLVVRSRSLVNLDQNQYNYNSTMTCTLKRPNALKMTTKPDGSIRYGLRQGSSESDLLDTELDLSPPPSSEIRSNYVNSIKNAFDAAIETQTQQQVKRAEAFDGLKQYFQDNKHSLQELLINNNVLIIEPFRPDEPRGPRSEKSDIGSPRSCRITGATIKSPVNEQSPTPSCNTLPRRHAKSLQNSRQGFYHPIKVNKELIDAELPDPDKVKTARELFQKVAKSNSTPAVSENKSGLKSLFNSISGKKIVTPEVKIVKEGKQATNDKKRSQLEQNLREDIKRYPVQKRWTDSGSLSSGVSSDFSCDQDWDFHQYHEGSNSGSHQDILEEYNTDDEAEYIYRYDDNERHPVSLEVLQKIRDCGTTVTYYGGKIISRSHGQFRSPMTMSIMDEIRQSVGACESRKKFESETEQPYLGVKFRLVKSNSCGSRLEIAGTEEESATKLISPCHENFRGKCIEEEVVEAKDGEEIDEENLKESMEELVNVKDCIQEGNQIVTNEEEDKVEADRYLTNGETNNNPQVMTWAELKLKEARKQWHCAPEAVRIPAQDMEFETFEVLDESASLNKPEKSETGRG